MYLGDTLVWRTTTSEPDGRNIHWIWQKDMTPFVSLWKKPQTLIFDLENIVNDIYTGVFKTTLTASFFKSDVQTGGHPPADLIIPITKRLGNLKKPSQFIVPEQIAMSAVANFPRNANRAVFSVDAKAQGTEEFWWNHFPQSTIRTFPQIGALGGYSSWREIQVELDGQLVGFVWPFPTIYTGGGDYRLHRPIVGIDAFDLREHAIDITPWLPLLCDGQTHTFRIKVIGLDDTNGNPDLPLSNTTPSWYVSGKVFVWLDDEGSVTTGSLNAVSEPKPMVSQKQHLVQDDQHNNATLEYTLLVSRKFSVSSHIKTQKHDGNFTWTQSLEYSNVGGIYDYGNGVANLLSITGTDEAKGHDISFSTQYHYPLHYERFLANPWTNQVTLVRVLDQGLEFSITGNSLFPTGLEAFIGSYNDSVLSTWRNTSSNVQVVRGIGEIERGSCRAEQMFSYSAKSRVNEGSTLIIPLYSREVKAVDNTLLKDNQIVEGNHK